MSKQLQLSILTREMQMLNIQPPPETPYPHTIITYDDPFTWESNYQREIEVRPAGEHTERQPVICSQCCSIVPVGETDPIALPKTPAEKLLSKARKSKCRYSCYVCFDGAHMPTSRSSLASLEWMVFMIKNRWGNLHSPKHYKKAIATLSRYMETLEEK